MIEQEKRQAILVLHDEGMGVREIARRLHVDRKTASKVIAGRAGQSPAERPARADRTPLDTDLLAELFERCQGRRQRMHEILTEEHGVAVSYPTLVRRLRELGIGKPREERCDSVPDEPGAEMQHDTSPYRVVLGDGSPVPVTCSCLYLRYSKRRYVRFYRSFGRFQMKCFLHEALTTWGYTAPLCIIDNTNLARLSGLGRNAVIVDEMARFALMHGFKLRCHERGHADRKAGEERSFATVETNFLPGRTFASLEDLNAQALEWATVRMENRRQGKTRVVPAQAFELEKPHLVRLPEHLPEPYEPHERQTDQYGYISFDGNFYWVPGQGRETIRVVEYSGRIELYLRSQLLATYPLPAHGVKNQRYSPPGMPQPRHQPKHRTNGMAEEERHLRAVDPVVGQYLDLALRPHGQGRPVFLRRLFLLSRRVTPQTFAAAVGRALKYGVLDPETVETIASLLVTRGTGQPLPQASVDEGYLDRQAYQDGFLTDLPNLDQYDLPQEDDHG